LLRKDENRVFGELNAFALKKSAMLPGAGKGAANLIREKNPPSAVYPAVTRTIIFFPP
jgi:hypothetical protein